MPHSHETPISDDLLERLTDAAGLALSGQMDEADAVLLLQLAPELLGELVRYRRLLGRQYAELGLEDEENVVAFHPPRGARLVLAIDNAGGAA